MKLWEKGYELNKEIEKFTVGNDYLVDRKLVKYDCLASIAHARMLHKIGVLTKKELNCLVKGLNEIINLDSKSEFKIRPEDEDCSTAIENYLTENFGDVGKKVHTARSRNDQILTALRLYQKTELSQLKELSIKFRKVLIKVSAKYGDIRIPGYTHMRKAMPTSIKMWLSSFADSVQDNIKLLDSAYKLLDQSPLGTAAGFGITGIEIDRKMTASELGFSKIQENPLYAQMSRGKFDSNLLNSLTQIMFDLNKLATDMILFSMPEFDFISLPVKFCTGSSIMPQKKNPDVLELVRAKYHVVLGEEFKVKSMIGNLMSGYHRDFQLTKEPVINSIEMTKAALKIMSLVVSEIEINKEKCDQALTKELFATEEVYNLVKKGIPFRKAYKEVAKKY